MEPGPGCATKRKNNYSDNCEPEKPTQSKSCGNEQHYQSNAGYYAID